MLIAVELREINGRYIHYPARSHPEYVDVIPEKISEATKILSELLFDSIFDQEKFESEHKIILNELFINYYTRFRV